MTKQELLEKMKSLRACREAMNYVTNHASNDAAEIGGTCDERAWLIWLLGRELRLERFVRVCARRAKAHAYAHAYAAYAAARAAARAAAAADAATYAAAPDAATYAAADAATYAAAPDAATYAAARAERDRQLAGLQRIFRGWANGLEAEK